MRWATVCPTCNQRIGNPAQSSGRFAGHEKISKYSWIEVAYIVISVLWLLAGLAIFAMGYFGASMFGTFDMFRGAASAGIAVGLLFQAEWVQFVAKILMLINMASGAYWMVLSLVFESFVLFVLGVLTLCVAGFSWWVINQLSD